MSKVERDFKQEIGAKEWWARREDIVRKEWSRGRLNRMDVRRKKTGAELWWAEQFGFAADKLEILESDRKNRIWKITLDGSSDFKEKKVDALAREQERDKLAVFLQELGVVARGNHQNVRKVRELAEGLMKDTGTGRDGLIHTLYTDAISSGLAVQRAKAEAMRAGFYRIDLVF